MPFPSSPPSDSAVLALPSEDVAGYEWTDHTGKISHVGKAPPAEGAYNITPLRRAAAPAPARSPRVTVEVSGGLIQCVSSDSGQCVDLLIADYDTEGSAEGEAGIVMLHTGPNAGLVALSRTRISKDPVKVAELFSAADADRLTSVSRPRERSGQ